LNWSDLASHFRLYNYFLKSGAAEEQIESFISNINSGDASPKRVIELVYQLHEISKSDSIPLDKVPSYIERKLEDKRKIDEEIKRADATLQSKNVTLEAIDDLNNMIKSLREVVGQAKRYKVNVMLENVPLSNGVHNVDEFKYIIDNVDKLFVHLDIPHAFISGGMASVIDYINTFRDKIIHIHWHDNHGQKDEHLPIEEGFIDHQKAAKTLKDIGYDRTITLEVFTNGSDVKSSADKLRTMWSA
jgi:sugar phosphate isomerase/epimerase